MTSFDDRGRSEEARFAHEQDFAFKVRARRNRLFGLWAAERLGLDGEAAEAYARKLILAGDAAVVVAVEGDFARHEPPIEPGDLKGRLDALAAQALASVRAG